MGRVCAKSFVCRCRLSDQQRARPVGGEIPKLFYRSCDCLGIQALKWFIQNRQRTGSRHIGEVQLLPFSTAQFSDSSFGVGGMISSWRGLSTEGVEISHRQVREKIVSRRDKPQSKLVSFPYRKAKHVHITQHNLTLVHRDYAAYPFKQSCLTPSIGRGEYGNLALA